MLDVSSGGLTTAQQLQVGPAYQTRFAEHIRAHVPGLHVMAVGLIETPDLAESVLQSGQADLIALGRPLLGDPHWPWHAAQRLGVTPHLPQAYQRGTRVKD